MEPIQGRHETSMFAPEEEEEDFISTMPDNVLTNILDRLPLQNAARTSLLARKWRFKWTLLISQLIFDEDFVDYLRYTKAENHPERVIGRILLQVRGAITKCVLYLDEELDVEVEDVIHWISFLSRKEIKDLTLEHCNEIPYKLPTHFYSCLELRHLKLINCRFNPPPTFHGFPNLLGLELYGSGSELGGVITLCPLLEILKLKNVYNSCKVKLDEIARLENLKILSLSLRNLYTTMDFSSSSTIFQLLGSLPKLQQLELNFRCCKLIEDVANKGLSIAFPCLKALRLSKIYLDNGIKLSCAFELISSCPNLQTLEFSASNRNADSPTQVDDYNTTGLLQLRSVTFDCLKGSENELRLIKYLLACAPFLERIVICLFLPSKDEKLKFASKLLKLHRASPVAEIDF